jgi:hypothetical protein
LEQPQDATGEDVVDSKQEVYGCSSGLKAAAAAAGDMVLSLAWSLAQQQDTQVMV